MTMQWTCDCACHQGSKLFHIEPDVRDVTEAAVACAKCINRHALSITADWPWPYIPKPANTKPPANEPPTPLPAADGIPYDPTDPAHDTDHS
jgi:hypothetical protein